MTHGSAGLRWTGHALVDVGIAGVCVFLARMQPEDVTLDDLDRVSDYLVDTYYSGKLNSYLTCVFMNASFVQPKEGSETRAAFVRQYLRAHRAEPDRRASGATCVFSGLPATSVLVRTHLPLFSGENILNFRPAGGTSVPAAGPYVVALMFLPMAGRKAQGGLLAVHADDPGFTLSFARKYLADNRRLLQLALPTARAVVHPQFEREQPIWSARKKHYKMADAKGPKSLVLADLTEISAKAGPSDVRPTPAALNVYLLSNSGQGPSLEYLAVPSGIVSFVRRAAQPPTQEAWHALATQFWPLTQDEDDDFILRRKTARKKRVTARVPGRAGWSANPAFEDLYDIFETGFTDRSRAHKWLTRHMLGRSDSHPRGVCFPGKRVQRWPLVELFLEEVLCMKVARIQTIRLFADKLAQRISERGDRDLDFALMRGSMPQLRASLQRVQRDTAKEGSVLFGFDEYTAVWIDDQDARGDIFLIRDLICIRVIERLGSLGYFATTPADLLNEGDDVTGAGEERDHE